MTTIAFLNDAPDEFILSKGVATSRVQVAKTGSFNDPRYGKFKITLADFDKWEANFATLAKADDHLGLPVDLDHNPEKKGDTEAVGWVTSLDRLGKDGKTPTANELWGTVEWNSLGKELVSDRRYAYLSPSYQHDYADEEGVKHGTALVGVALTNRPFLTMATVSLSKAFGLASEVEPDESAHSPVQMTTLLTNLRTKLSLGDDADDAAVTAAVDALLARAAKSDSPDGVNLSEAAASQGMVVLSAADHLSLAARASAGDVAVAAANADKFTTAFDKAVEDLKVLPAMKDTFQLSYNADPEATVKTLSELPTIVKGKPTGKTGDVEDDAEVKPDATTLAEATVEGWSVDKDRAALDAEATLLAQSENIDYNDALDRVMAKAA